MSKPYAAACDRNRDAILQVLKAVILPQHKSLLEIGSGTGQHAVYLAPHFPHLEWLTSDVKTQHPAIEAWLKEAQGNNLTGPIELEVGIHPLPQTQFNLIYTANTLHIMSWKKVISLLTMITGHCQTGTELVFYGPFNYQGNFTSTSNEEFNKWLQSRDPASGIRSFEAICDELAKGEFQLITDYEMPANNRCLHFRRK